MGTLYYIWCFESCLVLGYINLIDPYFYFNLFLPAERKREFHGTSMEHADSIRIGIHSSIYLAVPCIITGRLILFENHYR